MGLRPRRKRRLDGKGHILARFGLPLRRYFMLSTSIGVSVVGLALIVSALSIHYAERNASSAATLSVVDDESSVMIELAAVTFEVPELTLPEVSLAAEPPPTPVPVVEAPSRPPVPTLANVVAVKGRIDNVNLTFYDCMNQGFCGNMANGRKVYEGAAACSYNLAMGTKFVIVGDSTHRVYTCEDRGLLSNTWVDIFWHDPADGWRWQASVGRRGTIEIVELPR